MPPRSRKANINSTAAQLRTLAWATDEGELLGSEDDLVSSLGVSRPTLRQVARMLEHEGLLRVKRGSNGGYFAARPSVEIIEASVSAYLQMVDSDYEELSEIGAALWMVLARKAAAHRSEEKDQLIVEIRAKLLGLPAKVSFHEMFELDEYLRKQILQLVRSPYMDLIFHINRTFATSHYPFDPAEKDQTAEHVEFIEAWRTAKLLELEAIARGDVQLSELAARHARNLFHRRLYGHDLR